MSVSFALDLDENVVGDIVFVDNNGTQIESNAKPITQTTNNSLAKSWNLSKTGSFEMNGLKIKNGIKESPSNIENIDTRNNDNKNILSSVNELDFLGNIGSGAVGTVKKAVHKATNEVLAIKCIDFFFW